MIEYSLVLQDETYLKHLTLMNIPSVSEYFFTPSQSSPIGYIRCIDVEDNDFSDEPETFLQLAAARRVDPKPSCSLQRPVGWTRNLPAACSGLSGGTETFLQPAAACRVDPKPSCSLQRPVG